MRACALSVVVLCVCVLRGVCAVAVGATGPVVTLDSGPIRGVTKDGVNRFLGIPYAAPPVGALRFRAPQPPAPWTETLDATKSGPACAQILLATSGSNIVGSEDCLYLNVFVPVNASTSPEHPLAVMFWMFGGIFSWGDGWEFGAYDGTNFVNENNVILVSPNTRVGTLGFLALDELAAEAGDGSRGNYGVLDQRAALQWVQANIAAFGGDPTRVTIYGLSSGAMSACWHMAAEGSQGLFSRAIMQSGTCDSSVLFTTAEQATTYSLLYLASVGCARTETKDLLACVRALPTSVLASRSVPNLNDTAHLTKLATLAGLPTNPLPTLPKLYPLITFTPVIDKSPSGISDYPLGMLRQRAAAGRPAAAVEAVIAGVTKDEGTMFVPMLSQVLPSFPAIITSESQLREALSYVFGVALLTDILAEYPADPSRKFPYHELASDILRDWIFVCANRRLHSTLSASGVQTYGYRLTYKTDWIESSVLGTYHAAEVSLLFANPIALVHMFSKNDTIVSKEIGTYWTNLGKFGNPNMNLPSSSSSSSAHSASSSAGAKPYALAQWQQYQPALEHVLALDVPSYILNSTDVAFAHCDFWDAKHPQ